MENNQNEKFIADLRSILSNDEQLISKVISSLDSHRIVSYSLPNELSLLSTNGRVLFSIIMEPTMTQRALAVYLGISETMVEKTIKTLTEQGLITKTKVNRKNVYSFNTNVMRKNPDIQRLPLVFKSILNIGRESQKVDEEAPF
jgi:transcription initiation factor IIE alpha subunit